MSALEGPRGRLAGKVAVVTGASQTPGERVGNGRATAILFARESARVVLFSDEESSIEETAGEIDARRGWRGAQYG